MIIMRQLEHDSHVSLSLTPRIGECVLGFVLVTVPHNLRTSLVILRHEEKCVLLPITQVRLQHLPLHQIPQGMHFTSLRDSSSSHKLHPTLTPLIPLLEHLDDPFYSRLRCDVVRTTRPRRPIFFAALTAVKDDSQVP